MQNFREAVKDALKGTVTEEAATPWLEVLRDFATSINEAEPGVIAFVRKGTAPGVWHLMLGPKGLRDSRSIMLSIYVMPHAVSVLSGERRDFSSVDELQNFLVGFARLPTFRESLEALTEMSREPVLGFLRFGYPKDRSRSKDVLVRLQASEQHILAEASESQDRPTVKLRVEPAGPSPLGQGVYSKDNSPKWLVAGGYGLSIEDHNEKFGRIQLRGMPLDPSTLE